MLSGKTTIQMWLIECLFIGLRAAKVEPTVFELADVAEQAFSNTSIHVCDETNTNNSYVNNNNRVGGSSSANDITFFRNTGSVKLWTSSESLGEKGH